jgi:hypothetical protein
MILTGDSCIGRPTQPPWNGTGAVEPPSIDSRPTSVPSGVDTVSFPKRPAHTVVPSMPLPKRPCVLVDLPTLVNWATAPQDGPILLSASQVSSQGMYIDRNVCLLEDQGWEEFFCVQQGQSDLSPNIDYIRHLARSHLQHLWKHARAPMTTAPWFEERLASTMARGPHKSAFEYAEFLGDKLAEFVLKGQWVVLLYHMVKKLPHWFTCQMQVSPMGVIPQHEHCPYVIVDYSSFGAGKASTA